jgi:hypothetical protein
MHNDSTQRLIGRRLQREWAWLRRQPDAVRRASGWAIVDGQLDDLDQVLTAIGYATAATAHTEAALRRLVLEARHDELAARVVVHRLLPALIAVANRRLGHHDDPLGELVAAAWIAIRTFNPARRPGWLAPALVGDADYGAFRRGWRQSSSSELPGGLTFEPIADQSPPSTRELLDDVFDRAGACGVTDDDLALVRQLADGAPTEHLARVLDVTPRTIRNRRDRITDRLREIALAA